MKRLILLVLVLLLSSALVLPITAVAQTDDEEMQEFVSEDELMTVSYPADWFADEVLDLGFPAFVTANSEEILAAALDTTDEEKPAESGQIAVQVLLIPTDLLVFMEIELTDEMTDEEIASAFINALMNDDEGSSTEIGDPEKVVVGDELEIVVFPVSDSDEDYEGIGVVYEVADDILLLGFGSTYTGEFDEDLHDMFIEILTSVEYTGTAEDLIMALMSGGAE